jgi:spermidine/putrescine transport system substrate-binding protein
METIMTRQASTMTRGIFGRGTGAGGAVLALSLLGGPWAAAAEEIRVLNWQGYGTDEAWAVELFEERTGIEVVHDYFNSEQEMLTRLRTNPGVYDVVLINSAYTPVAAEEGLIEPIDPDRIATFGDLAPALRDSEYLTIDGEVYGVAWVWGVTSYAVDNGDVEEVPNTIEALWDERFAGRVGWRDDAVEAVQFAAIATGQDMNDPEDLDTIAEKLRALKPQIATFWSSEDQWNKYMDSDVFDIATYWSGSAARAQKTFDLDITFVIPPEGAIGWFDGLSVPTGAPNREAALAFIEFMTSPEFYVRWDNEVGAPASANLEAMAQLPDGAFNRDVLGDPVVAERLTFMAPMSDEERQTYLDLWQEVKTYIAQ